MFRILLPSLVALMTVASISSDLPRLTTNLASSRVDLPARSAARAGIAIVGTGGAAALDRVTALDSATGQFIVVTRPVCPGTCAPLDSASGTITSSDVVRLFTLIESEHVFSLRDDYAACDGCGDGAAYATTVQANGRRKVITSDGELTPMVLGRVHVALAEAIRAARGSD